jgi:hypothetical protein
MLSSCSSVPRSRVLSPCIISNGSPTVPRPCPGILRSDRVFRPEQSEGMPGTAMLDLTYCLPPLLSTAWYRRCTRA